MSSAAPMGVLAASGRLPLLAADAAFYAVFGVFVIAFVVLVVVTLRWAVRRDRVGRAEWVRRRQASGEAGPADSHGQTNGHVPRRADRRDRHPRPPA